MTYHRLRTDEVLAESRRAIEVLQRLATRLEVFADQIETELARRESESESKDARPD